MGENIDSSGIRGVDNATVGSHMRLVAVLAALVSATFFGLNAVASKLLFLPTAPAKFDPVSLFVARGFWTFPLFLIVAAVTRPRPMPAISRRTIALFALCGVMYGPGSNALSALGAAHTSAGHAVLLMSLFPPLAAFLAMMILRERLSPLRVVAIGIGVLGALILTFSKSGGAASIEGDAMIAVFIVTWAILTLGIRELDKSYPALFVVSVSGAIGSVLLVAIGGVLGRTDAIAIPLHHFDWGTIIWFDLEFILLLSLGGQLLQSIALRRLNVALVAALTSYGSIAAGLVASALLLGEKLSSAEIVAGLFLLAALGLSVMPEDLLRKLVQRKARAAEAVTR